MEGRSFILLRNINAVSILQFYAMAHPKISPQDAKKKYQGLSDNKKIKYIKQAIEDNRRVLVRIRS